MRRPRRARLFGFTLIEMIIVSTMIAIMATAMSALIIAVQRSYTGLEASGSIQSASEKALNRMMVMLVQSKRLFQQADSTWVAAVQLSPAPTAIAGSQLPVIETGGTLAPTLATFISTSVGNSLFFISVDSPTDMVVFNGSGSTQSVRIDVYHFNYYYLAQDNGLGLGGQKHLMLWEWHSKPYVDYNELAGLGDGVLTKNAAAFMYANSCIPSGCRYAVDVDTAVLSGANGLYSISGAGTFSSAAASILESTTQPMLSIMTGITGGGYHYGVSPNTGGSYNLLYPVPAFATAGSSPPFPNGFETMIVGANSARQVFVRLVVAAQGGFKGTMSNQQVVMATVRDLY